MKSIKNLIRSVHNILGYDIVKYEKFIEYKNVSKNKDVEFYQTHRADYYLPPNTDKDFIAIKMRRGECFEPEVIDLSRTLIKENSVVLDLGANFGQMSIEFARFVGEFGKVYSFEAQKNVFEILELNIKANKLETTIVPFYNAVYEESNLEMFFPNPDFIQFSTLGSYGIDPANKSGNMVKTLKIDDLKFDKQISFMKIDVQGADLAALAGAKQTILEHRMPILFEFEQQFQDVFNSSFQDYVDFVESINYKFERVILDINYLILPK